MATHHTLGPTPATVHWGVLDAKIPPRLTIDPGDTVTIEPDAANANNAIVKLNGVVVTGDGSAELPDGPSLDLVLE